MRAVATRGQDYCHRLASPCDLPSPSTFRVHSQTHIGSVHCLPDSLVQACSVPTHPAAFLCAAVCCVSVSWCRVARLAVVLRGGGPCCPRCGSALCCVSVCLFLAALLCCLLSCGRVCLSRVLSPCASLLFLLSVCSFSFLCRGLGALAFSFCFVSVRFACPLVALCFALFLRLSSCSLVLSLCFCFLFSLFLRVCRLCFSFFVRFSFLVSLLFCFLLPSFSLLFFSFLSLFFFFFFI